MDILPETIDSTIRKISNFSNVYMINIDFYEDVPATKFANPNFLYQYISIYTQLNNVQKVNMIKINEKQSILHAYF